MTKDSINKGKGRYAFLLFDATFKVVVCTPENEKLLIEILELLLPGKHIGSIDFMNKEMHGLVIEEKNANFDLLCKDKDTGEEFLVEVQNEPHDSYRDRMLYYSTFAIREQMTAKIAKMREDFENQLKHGGKARRSDKMDYSLKPVYVVSMVDFTLMHDNDDALEQEYISRYEIRNGRNCELFTHSLNFVFLEMGRLKLGPDDKDKCRNLLERFIFSMKNMHMLSERPEGFDDPLLVDLYTATELASMTVIRRQNYDKIMTTEIDRMCQLSYAEKKGRAEGLEKGIAKGIAKTAKAMKADGMAPELIAKYTGLSAEEIAKL